MTAPISSGDQVVIATGARYRSSQCLRRSVFQAAGRYYAAPELEARTCKGVQ